MSNQYKYQTHSTKPVYNRNQEHSRAATYANKSKANPHQNKASSHLSSSSMASSNSNATLNDVETTRSDMRDILWQNAELLQSDPNYRKKVWRYMSKVFYGNQSNSRYVFENYAKFSVPTTVRESAPAANNRLAVNDQNKDEAAADKTAPDREFDIITKAKLKLLLDREETYSDFLDLKMSSFAVSAQMWRILEAYACANENKFALSGAVQLCAVILHTFCQNNVEISDSDCSDTFFILQILTQIMHIYSLEDEKLMKDETLLLIDVLCVNEEKLVRKLNGLSIDVIDLSVFVSSWIRCLFVHHFEIEFVQRVIDLVLLEGPSVLIAIVYGILQFIKNDMLQCDTHYDVFEKLAGDKLRNHLKKHEFIARVMSKAQVLFTEQNYKYVIRGREKKSWPDLLGLPGQRHFRIAKGVGDKTKVKKAYQHWRRESRKNITNAYLGAEESSDDSEDDENEEKKHHHSSSSFNWTQNNSAAESLQEMERKLRDANETITRLQTMQIKEEEEAVEEDLNIVIDELPVTTATTMIQHNNSLIIHDDCAQESRHKKQAATLSDILYTSEEGDKIYCEPISDNLQPREIQCRTENWTDSWKNALNSLTDASISMQGYLCKMTASKFNSRGTLDKIQRRWFVLRGNYMTYYKTNLHTQPKSDKCVNLLNYKVNPVIHSKSKYALELISRPKENQHKKSKSTSIVLERTKFILIPDLDVNEAKQREIRDKWVKSLRLATKGAFLWDVLLNLKVESPSAEHMTSHTAFTAPSYHQHHHHHGQQQYQQHHNHYESHIVNTPPTKHQKRKQNNYFKHHNSDSLQTYNRRHYKLNNQSNKQKQPNNVHNNYPDYRI